MIWYCKYCVILKVTVFFTPKINTLKLESSGAPFWLHFGSLFGPVVDRFQFFLTKKKVFYNVFFTHVFSSKKGVVSESRRRVMTPLRVNYSCCLTIGSTLRAVAPNTPFVPEARWRIYIVMQNRGSSLSAPKCGTLGSYPQNAITCGKLSLITPKLH